MLLNVKKKMIALVVHNNNFNRKKNKFLKTLFFLWFFIVFVLSIMPVNNKVSFNIIGLDKIVHFLLYFVCSFICFFSYGIEKQEKRHLFVLILCIGYGILLEIIQYFIPYRSFSFLDIIANSLGDFFGLFSSKRINKYYG